MEPVVSIQEKLENTPPTKPTVVSWGPGRLDVFGIGFNHELLHRWFEAGSWNPPGGLPPSHLVVIYFSLHHNLQYLLKQDI